MPNFNIQFFTGVQLNWTKNIYFLSMNHSQKVFQHQNPIRANRIRNQEQTMKPVKIYIQEKVQVPKHHIIEKV